MKSRYTGLWLILAITLAIVLIYGLMEEDIQIGSWKIRKAPFREALMERHVPDSLKGDSDLALAGGAFGHGEVGPLESPLIVETDSTPQSILLIGDSMTLNLAYRLAKYARQNGHVFHAVNWDSSNTRIWGASDTLSHFIREFDASYVFISLGSNELYVKNPESRRPDVEKILKMVGNRPYVWIGPPNWKEDFGINDMIASACRPGSFFRSAGMEFERKKDHIHPTREASALWIDSIMRWLPKSGHPILMDVPSDSLGKVPTNVIFLKALNK